MALIVQKYGGTSVGDIERIKNVARRIIKAKEEGNKVVVVVSAMAGDTDKLIKMATLVYERPNTRELDVLLSCGERISIALMAITLESLGCPAISFTGRQVGILTDDIHTKAKIKKISAERIFNALNNNIVPVIAGFQGINDREDVTTLGRGGSDLTAVAIASAIKADVCEIYTDVDGVYTTDPNIVPNAKKIEKISYDEMLEMASLGAKVLQTRSVEFAKKYNVPIIVKSSFTNSTGTIVTKEDSKMEEEIVSGVTCDKNQAKITIIGVPDRPGIAAKVFTALSLAALNVDMIIQNVSARGLTDISFTVAKSDAPLALKHIEDIKSDIGYVNIGLDTDIAKISIVGVGMKSHAGVAARMFSALAAENINIMMISTSEIKISCVIALKYTELAIRVLHDIFICSREK